MFEAKDEVRLAVQALTRLSNSYERGQTISWQEIELITGDHNMNQARHVIQKWRWVLERDREIVTLVSNTVGVRLLTHKEAADEIPKLRQKKAYRQINRGLRQLRTVNQEKLSDHERRKLVMQVKHMREQRLKISRSQREARKPTETIPRRKRHV